MAVYKTRNWTFNSLNNEVIFADGKVTQLAARHNACLKALLDAQGQTVDYETLLLTVWGTTHRDNNTIASVISELRKKICSADPDFKYITTIPKKGYRFNGYDDVSILSIDEFKSQPQPQANDGNQQPAPTQIPKNQLSRSIRPPKLSSVLIILMALALCALWYFSNNSSEQKKIRI